MKPLWICPECGHEFVTANMWHSCGNYDLDTHFTNSEPHVRETFEAVVRATQTFGPVTVYAQKTRIVFMVRVRFGGVVTRRRWLNLSLWLTERVQHPRLVHTDVFGPRSYGMRFKLGSPDQVDEDLIRLIGHAYSVGQQKHLRSQAGRRSNVE